MGKLGKRNLKKLPRIGNRNTADERLTDTKHKEQINNHKTQINSDLTIATLNVRTLLGEERFVELEEALINIKADILGLSETRREGNDLIETPSGKLLSITGGTNGQRGTGFLFSERVKQNVNEVIGISDRITLAKLKFNNTSMTIVQVYAPTLKHSDEEVDDFYEELDDVLNEHRSELNFVIGDFNSKIGKKEDNTETQIGVYGLGERNPRGDKLIQFAQGQSLKVSNTFFRKRPKDKWTWRSPDGTVKNEIDYILCDNIQVIKDVEVIKNLNFNTDHRMVRSTIQVKRKHIRNKLYKLKLPKEIPLNDIKFNNAFIENVTKFQATDIQGLYTNLVDCIKIAAKQSFIKDPTVKKNSRLSGETLKLLDYRKELERMRDDNTDMQNNYNQINKCVKRMIRRDLRKYKTEVIQKEMNNRKSIKRIRQELNEGKHWIKQLKDHLGKNVTNRQGIVKTATSFYKKLYESTTPDAEKKLSQFVESLHEDDPPVPPILRSEVEAAVKNLKSGKSPGEEGIPNEYLKLGGSELVNHLTELFNKILITEEIPVQWLINDIILIHKKGSKDDVNNYRPISLMSTIYKLFSTIILRRITRNLEENQSEDQAGFRSGYSTIDHLHTLAQLMEKAGEFNLTLYIAFIDYSKAFDSVEHLPILTSLQRQGVATKYLRILAKIYSNSTAKISLDKEGEPFKLERGVRQGDPLSPKLFNSVLEEVFRKTEFKYGITIDGNKLSNLRFADDIVLFASSAQELEAMLIELQSRSKEVGLLLNPQKTKIMTNSTEIPVSLDNNQIEYVSEYTYLGQLMSFQNRRQKEIQRRIALAWKKFWSLKFILLDRTLNLKMRCSVMNTCILPALLYGAQTWSLTKKERDMLSVCQRKMERKILNITLRDKVRNEDIRRKTQIHDAPEVARQLKMKWAGHVMRLNNNRWSHKLTVWDPRIGKRNVGRPKSRWADEIKLNFGNRWSNIAKDRQIWKNLTKF